MRSTGKYIVTGSSDQLVKVWLYDEGAPTHVGTGHAGVVTNVKVSPDGRYVVSTSVDGGVFLWRFPHDDCVAPPPPSVAGSSGVIGGSGGSDGARGQQQRQADHSRRLSQKKTPAREENIAALSSRAWGTSRTKTYSSASGTGDSDASAYRAAGGIGKEYAGVTNGSVKCLCPRGAACRCVDRVGDGSRKSTPNVV